MDPKACLLELIAEIYRDDPDRDRIEELVEAYEQWRGRQGFEPNFAKLDYAANEAFKFFNVPKDGIGGDSLFAIAKLHIAMKCDGCPYCGRIQLSERDLFNVQVEDGLAVERRECEHCQKEFKFDYSPCGMGILDSHGGWRHVPFTGRKRVVVYVAGGIVQHVEIPTDDIIVEVHDRDEDRSEDDQVSVSVW